MPKVEELIRVMAEAGVPVSIDYVANRLNVAWGTARAILLQLALEGKIVAEKTTKSWIFKLRNSKQ